MTTPQNPYGAQARPAQQHSSSFPQGSRQQHSGPGQQGWGGPPQQPHQPPMTAGFAQHGPAGYAPQSRAPQAFASAGHPQGGYAPSGAAGVPGHRSGEYGAPQYPAGGRSQQQPPKNGMGVTALVLGILGVLFAWIPIIGVIAWPLVILGLIFGIIGIVRTRSGAADNPGVAISGTVLSAVGLIICIFWVAAVGSAVSSATPPATGAVSSSSGSSQTGGAFPGATSDDVVGNAGETLTVGDMQIAATPLTAGDSTLGTTLCSTVTYTNTGSSPAQFSGPIDWKLQDPSGAALMTGFSGSTNLLSTGELAPGGTTTGDMCFDQTASTSGRYVLLYKPMMSFSSARGAWLNQVG